MGAPLAFSSTTTNLAGSVLLASKSARAAVNRRSPRLDGWSSRVELPREPLGVAGCTDRAVEIEGFPERPVGRRRVADRGSQATTQLQDSRRQRATLDRRDQVLGAFE